MQVKKQQLEPDMGTTNWFKIGKGIYQGYILLPYLFNFHAECITQNAGLDDSQAGIKITARNINKLRYADDTTKIEEKLNSLLMEVKKESEKAGLKLNIQKTTIMASGLITLANRYGNKGNSERLFFTGLQNHCRW